MSKLPKIAAFLLIAIGLPALIIDKTSGSDIPLLVGLFILLVSKERKEDERAIAIKTSSVYIALIVSYGIKLLTTNLYSHNFISIQLTEINHFLIMVFSIAIIIYYTRMYINLHPRH